VGDPGDAALGVVAPLRDDAIGRCLFYLAAQIVIVEGGGAGRTRHPVDAVGRGSRHGETGQLIACIPGVGGGAGGGGTQVATEQQYKCRSEGGAKRSKQ